MAETNEQPLMTRCGGCRGTGQIPIHGDTTMVLRKLQAVVERGHENITARHLFSALPKRWRQTHTVTSVHNHLATLADLGQVVRGPKVGRAYTWTVAELGGRAA